MSNKLINETSPYLLQHAHNPVNWYPWGKEALQKAVTEDKPILVSIGYSACHWCHVMERESFEDEATASLMNEKFINIKIDREERPDLDHIYMDAVQAMAGNGGWPLHVFLTPDKKPFYGGTYFPPKPVMNRASWKEVLNAVADAFENKRDAIEQQATGLVQHLVDSNQFGLHTADAAFSIETINAACQNLLKQADTQWGGFGAAPKFPQTCSIQFLLRYFHLEKKRNQNGAKKALQQALLSIDKMLHGGIYDQLGGGFARYSTDVEWRVPHFEKMLYDNALLVALMSEAYQITKNETYKTAIAYTLQFVEREWQHTANGFYAALDADSEGEEGKFYVWSRKEIEAVLKEDADIYCRYYDVTDEGNWEGKNILRVLVPPEAFAKQVNMDISSLNQFLKNTNEKLLADREKRVRPLLDDKIILGWNALMNTAYSKAYAATGNEHYKEKAIAHMQFLLSAFANADGGMLRVWKDSKVKHPAFLDDYAYLIQALLQLHRVTADTEYLHSANRFCEKVLADFSEPSGYFYYTPQEQEDIIIRKKEVYDGATPSGNAVMAQNLLEMGILLGNTGWQERSRKMVNGLAVVMEKHPSSFGAWLACFYEMVTGTKEIVLTGNYKKHLKQLLSHPLPHTVIMASERASNEFPLLQNKTSQEPLTLFLCENYSCRQPVYRIEDVLEQLKE